MVHVGCSLHLKRNINIWHTKRIFQETPVILDKKKTDSSNSYSPIFFIYIVRSINFIQ